MSSHTLPDELFSTVCFSHAPKLDAPFYAMPLLWWISWLLGLSYYFHWSVATLVFFGFLCWCRCTVFDNLQISKNVSRQMKWLMGENKQRYRLEVSSSPQPSSALAFDGSERNWGGVGETVLIRKSKSKHRKGPSAAKMCVCSLTLFVSEGDQYSVWRCTWKVIGH